MNILAIITASAIAYLLGAAGERSWLRAELRITRHNNRRLIEQNAQLRRAMLERQRQLHSFSRN